jgi:Cu+-exporting ATPase
LVLLVQWEILIARLKEIHAPMTKTLVKDLVCGMDVATAETTARSDYKGHTYYFCCSGCKATFDHAPEQHLGEAAKGGKSACGCC